MKKHILGLAIFSFIVGATAFVYGIFFAVSPVVPVGVETPLAVSTYPATSCWKMKQQSKSDLVKVNQALFNLQTREFSWELATPDADGLIALHFFLKDAAGTHYIASEEINNKFSRKGILRYKSAYMLDQSESFENLYVIPQFNSEGMNYSENYQVDGDRFQPKFDVMKAVPVTIDYGR